MWRVVWERRGVVLPLNPRNRRLDVFRGRREIRGVLRYCKAYSGIARGAPTGAAYQWFSSLPKLQLCVASWCDVM